MAELVPVMEAFRVQLTSGRFRQRSGRMDVRQASLEVGANLHKCKVKRDS